ncbi:hypothetical protein D3C78_1034370 [compost metagenome]
MCAEVVVFLHSTPIVIDHSGPFRFRANAVLPVVFIRKAAARPTEYRNVQLLERFQHVLAIALHVFDR